MHRISLSKAGVLIYELLSHLKKKYEKEKKARFIPARILFLLNETRI